MTIEEAIKSLEIQLMGFNVDAIDDAISLAIEALEKQIPYKITNIILADYINVYEGACKCGAVLLEGIKYCDNCGQKLDWED